MSGTALEDMTQEQIVGVFKKAMNDATVWPSYYGLFDKWVDTDAENPTVQVIRSIYMFGSPIQVTVDGEVIRYKDKTDREVEQLEHFNDRFLYPFVE